MIKTVVGSFDSFAEAQEVVRDLQDEGYMASDISIVARHGAGGADADAQLDDDPAVGTARDMRDLGMVDRDEATIADRSARVDLGRADAGFASTTPGTGLSDASGVAGGVGSTRGLLREDVTGAELRADDLRETASERTRSEAREVGETDGATGAATGAVAGGVLGGAAGVAASLMSLAIPGIGPVLAAGPIIAGLTGAGVGAIAGGLIGGLTSIGVSEDHAGYYAEAVRRGGALVTVRCDESRAERAAAVMREHGAVDIERRVERWRGSGWTGHDPSAKPYTSDEVELERSGESGIRTPRARSSSEWSRYEDDFRSDFQTHYAERGGDFDEYAPAYQHGMRSAQANPGRGWDAAESDVRRDWERDNPGSEWQRFKGAARRGWERLSDDVERALPGDSDREGK